MNNFQKLIRRVQKKKTAEPVAGKRGRKGLRHRKRKPLSKKAKIWIAVGVTLGVLLIAGIVTGVIWFQKTFSYDYNPITKNPDDLAAVEVPEEHKGIVNIALFGIDSRDADYKGLSDSIMIISINPETGSVKLVSIMRDSLVKVDGHGYQKINAAYSLGGPVLAIKTLNQTFKLNIQNYATVDFVGMAEIVDAVGGVEVELTKAEIYYTNACIDEIANARGLKKDHVSKSGVQTLNGIQAVGYSRVRAVPTVNGTRDDYGRTERQRLVMNQLFEKATQLPLTSYPGLIQRLLPYIETSMGFEDIFSLAKILKADGITMQQNRIPMDDAIISGGFSVKGLGSCVYYDLDYAAKLLNAFFFDNITFEEYAETNGIEKNKWFGSSGGSTGSSGTSTKSPTSSSGGSSTGDTTDTATSTDSGAGTTDTDTSVTSSPAILPPTDTSSGGTSSTGTSTSDTTDTGTESDTSDTGTSTDSSDSSSSATSTDRPASSDTSDTTDSSEAGSTSSDTADGGSDSAGEDE